MSEPPNIIRAKSEANKLLEKYFIESPEEIVVEDIAMAQGLLVIDGGIEGAEARLLHNGNNGIIRIKKNDNQSRRRFSIAHELGHWILHKDSNVLDYCQNIEAGILSDKVNASETEANSFAAELLMPRSLFLPLCRQEEPSIELLKKLTETFKTSLTSTALRFIEFTNENCFVIFSSGNEIQRWRKTNKSNLKIDQYHSIQKNSQTYKCLSGQVTETTMKKVFTEVWFPSPPKGYRVDIREQAIKLGNYPYVLTLLLVHEEEYSFTDDDYE